MEIKELNNLILTSLRWGFKTITPWKKKKYMQDSQSWAEQRYVDGWNDCIKEIKKNRARYLKNLEKKIND